jgi:hypothetical protein
MLTSHLANRRIHRVADNGGARDDRGAQKRPEHDEQRFARSSDRIAEREPAQNRSTSENEDERKRDEECDQKRRRHRTATSGTSF